MANGRITTLVLAEKIDSLRHTVDKLVEVVEQHVKDDKIVENKVLLLEASEQRRQWHIRNLWGACTGAVIAALGAMFYK